MAQTAQTITQTQERKDSLSVLPMGVGRKLYARLGNFLQLLMGEVEQEGGSWDVFGRALQPDQLSRVTMCARILVAPHPPILKDDKEGTNTIQVPKESFKAFQNRVRQWCAQRGIKTGFLNVDPEKWKAFHAAARGRSFEIMKHQFNRWWLPLSDGREVQKTHGYNGNPVVFWYWVMRNDPMGFFGVIPNDDDELFRNGDDLYASCFLRDGQDREFDLLDVVVRWRGRRALVAFREI